MPYSTKYAVVAILPRSSLESGTDGAPPQANSGAGTFPLSFGVPFNSTDYPIKRGSTQIEAGFFGPPGGAFMVRVFDDIPSMQEFLNASAEDLTAHGALVWTVPILG
jgi:hypothetical protein